MIGGEASIAVPTAQPEEAFAVYAEAEGHERPLLQIGVTFGRLMDDIVVPYQTDETFFIDGAPVTPAKLKRIKLLRLKPEFAYARASFNATLTTATEPFRKLYGQQYVERFEHMLREHSEDVTAQVIKAYNQAIKPSIKDYLPKREQLISAATTLFVEGVKALGKSSG